MRSIRFHSILLSLVLVATSCRSPEPPDQEPLDVVEVTIGQLQASIQSGRMSCREVVQAYLDRIVRYDQASGLNAIAVVNPKALERADQLDAKRQAGEPLGELYCAPILVKDNFDTHDLPTSAGSITLKNSYPPDDAFMVRRIREADAVVIAKTNMAEWAFSPRRTESSSYGVTANAYALDRVPAGSSGGTASGVAASFGVAGLGSDTGNSIRGPSSHLALFGIRSTIGLTSRDGVVPLAFDRDIAGPMTRTVEDGARLFNVVAGFDPADPFTEEGKREEDYLGRLQTDGLQGARIGVLRALVNTEDADPEVTAVFEQALKDLAAAGAEIVDPFELETLEAHLEGRNMFCARFRYDMRQYLKSLGEDAPIKDVMEAFETGQYSEYTKRSFEYFSSRPADIAPRDWEEPCLPFLENPGRRAYLEDLTRAMDGAGVNAIVYPTWTNPPAHLDKAREEYKGDNSQLVAPATGMPAITVPMGFTYGSLPAGLQILGRRYDDGLLIQYAYAYEQATKHRRPPEVFPALQ